MIGGRAGFPNAVMIRARAETRPYNIHASRIPHPASRITWVAPHVCASGVDVDCYGERLGVRGQRAAIVAVER
jgi:hypothetical protein